MPKISEYMKKSAGKVNIKQGTDYSGMFLGVDSSGNVKPMNVIFEVTTVDETKSYLGLT